MSEPHDIDPVEEHAAVADAASLRARCAALEACLRDVVAAVERNRTAAYLRTHGAVLRAKALVDWKDGGR